MRFDILTIFPQFFESPLRQSLIQKAISAEKIEVHITDTRQFATGVHRQVDDTPYGGGPGMVLKAKPVVTAIESIPRTARSLRILLGPRGKPFNQEWARELATYSQLILVCGRYEGVDERVVSLGIDEELSVGDYILAGGETAAWIVVEAVARLVHGVVGNIASIATESFREGLLEYPQYTKPAEFRGLKVPEVLLGGNHKEIENWRRKKSLEMTRLRRPDLFQRAKK